MKRNIQIALLLLIVILCITFYNIYLIEPEKLISQKKLIEVPISEDNQNNLIKNLKYEIKLENNSQYIISSELSEITYETGTPHEVKNVTSGERFVSVFCFSRF